MESTVWNVDTDQPFEQKHWPLFACWHGCVIFFFWLFLLTLPLLAVFLATLFLFFATLLLLTTLLLFFLLVLIAASRCGIPGAEAGPTVRWAALRWDEVRSATLFSLWYKYYLHHTNNKHNQYNSKGECPAGWLALAEGVVLVFRGVTSGCRSVTPGCRSVKHSCRDVTPSCRGVTPGCGGVTSGCKGATFQKTWSGRPLFRHIWNFVCFCVFTWGRGEGGCSDQGFAWFGSHTWISMPSSFKMEEF